MRSPTPVPPTWAAEIASWCVAMQAMRLSPQTIELRVYHLRRLARAGLASSPWQLRPRVLVDWTGGREWSRETARAFRSSVRRFWGWGVGTQRTDENLGEALPMVRAQEPHPRPAEVSAVAHAVAASDSRVVLMLRLANELGMRRAEVAQVHPVNDMVRDIFGWSLIVHGKGAKQRVLPLPDDLAEVLHTAPAGYLFPNPQGGPLSPHWVGTLVSRALPVGTTMHQLRHLCATEIHDQTHDLRLVQTLLGHASLATTQRYIAIDESKVREAIASRSLRWGRSRAS